MVLEFPQAIKGHVIQLSFCGNIAAERSGGGRSAPWGKPIVAFIDSAVGDQHLSVGGLPR